MSQFDFPRINFSGQSFINPGTANNNLLLPLVMYDPIQAKTVLPPRIYLSSDLILLYKLDGLPLPENAVVEQEDKQLSFVEIEPINTREKYVEWAKTPLGKCQWDEPYHELYEVVTCKRLQKPLIGRLPASWNYYGGMEFGFEGVRIKSVAVLDSKIGQQFLTANTPNCPADVAKILGSTLDMDNTRGGSSAVMIDVLPNLALYSQVFCDHFQMKKEGESLLKGKPLKASLRFLNHERIVNQNGVYGASGSFFSVIPVADLEGEDDAFILSFFRKYGQNKSVIKGVFIRYNLFEVKENQEIDYQIWGNKANPAFATVVGSITPWYEDDMKSIAMGRQLLPEMPFLNQKKIAPFVCRVDTHQKAVTLDILGSIPEQLTAEQPSPIYETYPLGTLTLKLLQKENQEIEIGTFQITPQHFSRDDVMATGGMIEVSFKDNPTLTSESFESGFLALYGQSKSSEGAQGTDVLLMKESPYMIASDQAGMYANQGQNGEGFHSYSSQKEPCQIRVYQRGKPFIGDFPLTVMELKITGVGASVRPFLVTNHFRDQQTLSFPTDQAANAMYVFYPEPPASISEDLIAEIRRTGFFVNLRVLSQRDYGKYLDPNHAAYPTPVTFDVLYKELLQTSDLVFPMASQITPFTEVYFRKGARFIKQRMSPDNWASATYMPSSRDMSSDQWKLFCKWMEQMEINL